MTFVVVSLVVWLVWALVSRAQWKRAYLEQVEWLRMYQTRLLEQQEKFMARSRTLQERITLAQERLGKRQ